MSGARCPQVNDAAFVKWREQYYAERGPMHSDFCWYAAADAFAAGRAEGLREVLNLPTRMLNTPLICAISARLREIEGEGSSDGK